ncbi:MAG: RNA polymerase sigma factor [Crocinitomicaceae bacterium]
MSTKSIQLYVITPEVIESFVQGEKKGFDIIYGAYSSGMYSICLRYTRCADDANDVLQETFIKIYENRAKFDTSKEIGPWIKTITIRTALNYIKTNYKWTLTDDDYTFDTAQVDSAQENMNEANDLKRKLKLALEQLPDGYRTVFTLYTIDNLTHKEIAEYLGISEGTSKSQYSKAKKMIKQLLTTEKLAS